MKRFLVFGLLFLTGCSTAPLADFLDWVSPGKIREMQGGPVGGVCAPQGRMPGTGVAVPVPPGGVPAVPPPGPVQPGMGQPVPFPATNPAPIIQPPGNAGPASNSRPAQTPVPFPGQ